MADLTIGTLEGDGPQLFGDIRGIAVGADGTIYVLDHQAVEIRAFSADGSYLTTTARRGGGPGEISRANGLTLAPDGRLWVNDYGNRTLTVLTVDGQEIVRHPSALPGFEFIWNGVIDAAGVVWQRWSQPAGGIDFTSVGYLEDLVDTYYISFDPATAALDSVSLGTTTLSSYRARYSEGMVGLEIPFSAKTLSAVAPSSAIWSARSDAYVLTRMNTAGDTSLVLQADVFEPRVSPADISAWRADVAPMLERVPSAAAEIEGMLPDRKPVLAQLVVDDTDRLWVGRTVPAGEAPLFDVFTAGGDYLRSVRLFPGLSYLSPVIRNGRVHALVTGEYDEQYIVVGSVPEME